MVKVHAQLVTKKGYLISDSEANRDVINLQQDSTVSSESFVLFIMFFFPAVAIVLGAYGSRRESRTGG